MRLFISECYHCNRRIYLPITALSRDQLAERIGYSFEIECPHCQNYSSHVVNEVLAKPGLSSTPAGAILGGLVGLIGGPIGMLIGTGLGTLWGADADENERRRVNRFNRS